MSNKERESFLHGAISRAPGKRRIKPTNLAIEDFPAHDDDDSDEEFQVPVSDPDDSSAGEENSSDDEDNEDNGSAKTTEDDDIQIVGEKKRSDKPEPLICSICLNMRNVEGDRVIQCDKCGVSVHEGCYAVVDSEDDQTSVVSNFSTEPWFCEPCLFDLEKPPHCELCPQKFGAFKRADVGGKWIHLTCALFTPGISFGDIDNLSAVSWQEIDYKRFGRKPCDACTDVLEARTGITVQCEAGLCKNHYHVTCAQRLGLLVDAESEGLHELSDKHVDPHFILCRSHNISELVTRRRANYAIFMRQEQKRLTTLNRRLLDQRESYKLSRQRKQHDERIKKLENVSIHLPAVHNKRQRLVQTSSDFLEAFTEKAELFGVPPQEFKDAFTRLPPSQISYLTPAFSTEFVKYFENRENSVFAEEQKRLREGECELKKVEQAEKDLQLMLSKLSTKLPESPPRPLKQKLSLEDRFTSLCEKLNISIEQEEKREKSVEKLHKKKQAPKTKPQKAEEPPAKKRRPKTESPLKSPKNSSAGAIHSSTTANPRTLKNGQLRYGRFDRGSVASTSIDTNLDPEGQDSRASSDGPPLLRSANDPHANSVGTDLYSDNDDDKETPTALLPMISVDENTKTKKRLTSKNSKRV